MTKKNIIALADAIRQVHEPGYNPANHFNYHQLSTLADFCQSQNPNFKRDRWLAYIAGECGPNGGTTKTTINHEK